MAAFRSRDQAQEVQCELQTLHQVDLSHRQLAMSQGIDKEGAAEGKLCSD